MSKKTATGSASNIANKIGNSGTSTMPSKATPKPSANKGAAKEAFDRTMARMKEENAKALQLNKELMGEIEDLKKSADENVQIISDQKQTIEHYKQEAETFGRIRSGLENEVKTLEDRIAKLDSNLAIARADKEAAEEAMNGLRESANKAEELEAKIQTADASIQRKDIQLAELDGKFKKQAKNLADKQIELSDAAERIRELETKVSRYSTGAVAVAALAVVLLIALFLK